MIMQYAIEDGEVYVLEANPRARCRWYPRVCNIKMVRALATDIMTSVSGQCQSFRHFDRERRFLITGEDAGIRSRCSLRLTRYWDRRCTRQEFWGHVTEITQGERFTQGTGALTQTREHQVPEPYCSVSTDMDKPELIEVAKGFYDCGFKLMGTGRTYDIMAAAGLPAEKIAKIDEDVEHS